MNVSCVELGRRIREARDQACLTQSELAAIAGITIGTLSRVERGAFEPSLYTVVRLADSLGVDIHQLVHGTPSMRQPFVGLSNRLKQVCNLCRRLLPAEQEVMLDLARSLRARRPYTARGQKTQ